MDEQAHRQYIEQIENETEQINRQTIRTMAKTRRRRQQEAAITTAVVRYARVAALSTLVLAAALYVAGFERWAAVYPLSICLGTLTLLIGFPPYLHTMKATRENVSNMAVGAAVSLVGIVMAALLP